MGAETKIEWTDHTFNPWIGCTKVSEGCRNCYAARDNERRKWNGGAWGPGALRKVTSAANWHEPVKWARAARKAAVREKVFCASLADVFDVEAPRLARADLWQLVGDTCDALDWQFVTKRPERIEEVMAEDDLNDGFFELCRAWLLTTTENQDALEARVPALLEVPAAVHGVSCEPLLGPLNFRSETPDGGWDHLRGLVWCEGRGTKAAPKLDWVICGGESGPNARPMHPYWARGLRDQCRAAGVAFFFKQWGEWLPINQAQASQRSLTVHAHGLISLDGDTSQHSGADHQDPEFGLYTRDLDGNDYAAAVYRVGKHNAGALLDGAEYKQFPAVG